MERDVEFATLETLGVPARKVVRSILIEVAVIGTASATIGVPLAYLFGKVFALVMQEVLYYFPVLLRPFDGDNDLHLRSCSL
ncbi:MAG: FtsX-like permease family protein [Desulfosudis oleivorans]|nr:FtsX-like permease family protein [Desulfosudis oleivorans]